MHNEGELNLFRTSISSPGYEVQNDISEYRQVNLVSSPVYIDDANDNENSVKQFQLEESPYIVGTVSSKQEHPSLALKTY